MKEQVKLEKNEVRSVHIDKKDDDDLLKKKAQRKNGMVYAHNDKGVSKFIEIENVYVEEHGKTVGDVFKDLYKEIEDLKVSIKVLKKVLKNTRSVANQTKEKVEKYVV